MPCYKCSNGKWKYGQKGNCQFDTLESCKAAERAIHAREGGKATKDFEPCDDCKKTLESGRPKRYNN